MKPTDKELRELDAWIAVHLFGFYVHHEGKVPYISKAPPDWNRKDGLLPEYTTDRAAAMEVLEKCAEKCRSPILIDKIKSQWVVWQHGHSLYKEDRAADTLALAICLFAKQLFSK